MNRKRRLGLIRAYYALRTILLSTSLTLVGVAYGADLVPISPSVEHSKKATCGIKWSFNKSQPIKYFGVYRGLTSDFWEADCIAEVGNTTERLTDWGADQYQTYYYWVIPFDYNDESSVLDYFDLSRYCCKNQRYWGANDVYLTSSVKTLAVGQTLPLYFKVNVGTHNDPVYDHVKPDRVVFTRMTDLEDNAVTDIATVYGYRDYKYSSDNTYLKANGSFGYLNAYKPGVLYLRAYFKSATTVTPLRIEIKKPTFNLYAPSGEVDILTSNYRDLYLKCNGKFVCPDVEHLMGDSVSICPVSMFASTDEVPDGLYDNSFGFLNMVHSEGITMYDIKYNGMLVAEYQIAPTWDYSKELKFAFMNSSGTVVNSYKTGIEYSFGIKYGDYAMPLKISKYGYSWLTIWEPSGSLSNFLWSWYFSMGYTGVNVGDLEMFYYGPTYIGNSIELGSFICHSPGFVTIEAMVLDRTITNQIQIKNN